MTTRQRFRLSIGTELSFITAGDADKPAVLLLHGFPTSAQTFRAVVPELAKVAYVIAPDLPGHGESDVLPAPERVLGFIIQNANAHRTGFGPEWAGTMAYWSQPNAENEAAATAHLTYEGTRDQYTSGVPPEVAARISSAGWEEDWRVMNLPGRMDAQRALIADYAHYVARFDEIAEYLARWQPPALMLWGRHDPFFNLAETLSWMQDLPRMEAHVFDGGHLLLETHAAACASLMRDFISSATAL